jgi:hypothetical protein
MEDLNIGGRQNTTENKNLALANLELRLCCLNIAGPKPG